MFKHIYRWINYLHYCYIKKCWYWTNPAIHSQTSSNILLQNNTDTFNMHVACLSTNPNWSIEKIIIQLQHHTPKKRSLFLYDMLSVSLRVSPLLEAVLVFARADYRTQCVRLKVCVHDVVPLLQTSLQRLVLVDQVFVLWRVHHVFYLLQLTGEWMNERMNGWSE